LPVGWDHPCCQSWDHLEGPPTPAGLSFGWVSDEEAPLAFREVSVVQVKEALRRWLSGDGERPIARGVGIDRKTGIRWRYGRRVKSSAGAFVIHAPVNITDPSPRSPRSRPPSPTHRKPIHRSPRRRKPRLLRVRGPMISPTTGSILPGAGFSSLPWSADSSSFDDERRGLRRDPAAR